MTQILMETSTSTNPATIVNDFCITFSTVNGSGSATANNVLLRALFRMGIPVSGKNIFPSNIQGLPTWYTIRVNKDGFLARVERDDIVVAMNPATFTNEMNYLVPGGVLLYSDDIKMPVTRADIIAYPMPVKKITREMEVPPNLRDYIANMVYVGVLAQLLGIDLEKIHQALDAHFKGKQKAINSNYTVIEASAKWAAANLVKRDNYRVESMNGTEGYILTDGNTAGALGAIFGGVQFSAWYPITPASSLSETMNEYLPSLRQDAETGKATCAVVQAEDELAAIGMVVGAGWAGLRSMTSTSGPGLSLMTEYLGLAYYSEVPLVVWDVQRVGPSTGLPTRTAQGDITSTYFMSHGDTEFVMLFPGSVSECFEYGWKAFDLAEELQTPVIVMSDLDFGMNEWMTKKFEYPDTPINRGKILWEDGLDKIMERTKGDWGRYQDLDGDGIPYRTVAGNRRPEAGYLTRGTGHDEKARYSEEPEVWERDLKRLSLKFQTARKIAPKPVIHAMADARIGIIACGSTDPAVEEARAMLASEGLKTDYCRVRSLPLCQEVIDFIAAHDRTYVVEINRDGQLKQILTLEIPHLCTQLHQVSHIDGMPLSARWVKDQILDQEERKNG
jgi:2-oxoglutarate/2-oxoacid ferredoxin oxidoreductase subunit alpha